jgi:hypothetical protein
VRQIGFQTANNPKRSDAVRAVIQIVIVQRVNSSGGPANSNVGAFGEWRGSRVWHQHLAEMLQNTSDT